MGRKVHRAQPVVSHIFAPLEVIDANHQGQSRPLENEKALNLFYGLASRSKPDIRDSHVNEDQYTPKEKPLQGCHVGLFPFDPRHTTALVLYRVP
jgi:hypothetical protein